MNPEIKLSKIKKIDYEEIQNVANGFKIRSKQSKEKMDTILKKSKQSIVNSKIIEHKKVWNLESIKLNNKKRKLQRDIDSLINAKSDTFGYHLSHISDKIHEDHMQFKSNIIDNVWTLCEDLKEWKLKKSRGYKVPDSEPIKEVIEVTKTKLNEISQDLKMEEECLTNEIEREVNQYLSPLKNDNIYLRVGSGIPSEAWEIECCDREVLTDLLSQFILLDSYFQSKLDAILEECEFVDERSAPNNWPAYVVELFEHIHEVYFTQVTVNRNQLWQDIIKIIFPNSTPKTLADTEQFIHQKKVFRDKTQALVADWKYDRTELFNKIKASLIEYNDEMIITQIEAENVRNQKEICRQLNERVNKWREQKEQLYSLEESYKQEIEEKRTLEAEEQMEKELLNRNKTKQKIFQYKLNKNYQNEMQMIEKQRRIEELKDYLQTQAEIDNERVEYREQLRLLKIEELNEKKHILCEKQKLSEIKLNKLIEQVRPNVESDPKRLLKLTEAWRHHIDEDGDQSTVTESIFSGTKDVGRYALPLYTYNSKDVLSDPRFRVENALRQAGLMDSEYARNVMKSIPGSHIPRKDCNLSDINFLKHD